MNVPAMWLVLSSHPFATTTTRQCAMSCASRHDKQGPITSASLYAGMTTVPIMLAIADGGVATRKRSPLVDQ